MSDLPIHVMPEEDSDSLDIDLEVIDDMISSDLILREEIEERMANYKTGLEALSLLDPYPKQTYATHSVTGVPSWVKRFSNAARTRNAATCRSKSRAITRSPPCLKQHILVSTKLRRHFLSKAARFYQVCGKPRP